MKLLPLNNYLQAKRTYTNKNKSNEFMELEIIALSFSIPGERRFEVGQTIYALHQNPILFATNVTKVNSRNYDVYLVKRADVLAVEVDENGDDVFLHIEKASYKMTKKELTQSEEVDEDQEDEPPFPHSRI